MDDDVEAHPLPVGDLPPGTLWRVGQKQTALAAIAVGAELGASHFSILNRGSPSPHRRTWAKRRRDLPHPAAKRVEFRCPDPTANPYLAFSAMLMAGLDGVINKIDPGQPLDKDIYSMSAEEAAGIQQVPGSLEEALNALKNDHEFLLRGDVFTKDLIDTWIDYKIENEVEPMRLRPHPYEYALYLDA